MIVLSQFHLVAILGECLDTLPQIWWLLHPTGLCPPHACAPMPASTVALRHAHLLEGPTSKPLTSLNLSCCTLGIGSIYFSHFSDKTAPGSKGSRLIVHRSRESMVMRKRGGCSYWVCCQQAERGSRWYSVCFLQFIHSRAPPLWCHPHSGMGLPSSAKPSWKYSQIHPAVWFLGNYNLVKDNEVKYDSIQEPDTLSSLRPLYLGEEYGFSIPSLKT